MEILLATGTNQEFLQAAKTVGGKKVGTGGYSPRKGGKRKGKAKREGAGKSNGKGAGSKSGSGIPGGTEAFLGTLKGGGKRKGKGGGSGGRSGKKGKKGAWGIALRSLPIWNAAKFQLKARRAAAGLKTAMAQAGAARGQALSLVRQWLAEGARAGAGADTRDMWTQVARDCVHQLSLSQLSLDRAAEILETGDADASDAVFKLSGAATMADNCQGSFDFVRRTEDAEGGDGGGSGRYGMTAQVRVSCGWCAGELVRAGVSSGHELPRWQGVSAKQSGTNSSRQSLSPLIPYSSLPFPCRSAFVAHWSNQETAADLRDSIVTLQQQTIDLQQIAAAAAATATDDDGGDGADVGDAAASAPPPPAPAAPGDAGSADGSTSTNAPSDSSNDVAPPPPSSTQEDVAVPASPSSNEVTFESPQKPPPSSTQEDVAVPTSPSGNDQSTSEGGPRGSSVGLTPVNGQDGAAASDGRLLAESWPSMMGGGGVKGKEEKRGRRMQDGGAGERVEGSVGDGGDAEAEKEQGERVAVGGVEGEQMAGGEEGGEVRWVVGGGEGEVVGEIVGDEEGTSPQDPYLDLDPYVGPTGSSSDGPDDVEGQASDVEVPPADPPALPPDCPKPIVRPPPLLAPFSIPRLMPNLVVAQDGSGDFTTIQDALLSAPKKPKGRFVILVMPGVYKERFEVGKPNITLVGLSPALTIITGNASVGTNYTTFNSATVAIEGDYFAAVNIRFENTAGKINNQAVALRVSADQCAFHNCEFWGFQDTLYTHSGRQYYRNCFITGNVDFIFGNAAAIFDNCTIQIRQHTSGAPVAASSRQTSTDPTGLVIMNSRVVGETTRCVVGFLGRPWKSYARAAVINSYLSPQVSSLGWMDWNGQVNDTISFIEFNNTGPGANGPRVPWLRPGILANVTAVSDFLPEKFLYPFGVIRALLPWL
ncbi:unnamed protein product [Closterium sp. NIES-64]|nr:unnamed protein product [Closterium sp. NIES-64]